VALYSVNSAGRSLLAQNGRYKLRWRSAYVATLCDLESKSLLLTQQKWNDSWEGLRAALVIAHPGHELRIHHWLERSKPQVFVLTDGSGLTNSSRTHRTEALLELATAVKGPIFGSVSDKQFYEAIVAGDADLFVALSHDLATALDESGVDYVVGDAVEGVEPGHDVCRLIVNAAVKRIEASCGRRLGNFEFLVEGPPDACPPAGRDQAIVVTLDEEAYRRKLEAARAYPELAIDVERQVNSHGADAFRVEYLLPVRYDFEIASRFDHPAIYESRGEKLVAKGVFAEAIRFRRHIAPLAARLERDAGTSIR